MTPRKGSTSSEGSDQLPELPTLSNKRRLLEQGSQSKAVLSPARAASASQSPRSNRKRTATPESTSKTVDRTVTRSAKKRRVNAVESEEEAATDEHILTVRPSVLKKRRRKPVIEIPDEEEEEPVVETQDQETQNSSVGKLATAKIFPHQSAAPAPLSACSVATLVESLPPAGIPPSSGLPATASTSKRAVTPDPLSTLASTATEQRSSQRAFAVTRKSNAENKSPAPLAAVPSEPASTTKPSSQAGRSTLSNTKGSSVTLPGTPTLHSGSSPDQPTPRPPPNAESPEPAETHASQSVRSRAGSSAGSMAESEFSWNPNNRDSLERPQRIQHEMDREERRKGKQRRIASEDELEDSEKEDNGHEIAEPAKKNLAPDSIKQDKQIQKDTEMQSDTEDDEAEDVNQLQAPPSAQTRIVVSTDAEEDETSGDEVTVSKAVTGKARERSDRRTARHRDRDSGYVKSPLKSYKSQSQQDPSLEAIDKKKPKATRPGVPAQTRSTRSGATRSAQAKPLKKTAKVVEVEHGETTEEEQEEQAQEQEEEDDERAEEPAKRGSMRKSSRISDGGDGEEDDQVPTKKELAVEQNMPTRASLRTRAPANYAPLVTRNGNLRRQNTSDPDISTKSSKAKGNPVKPGPTTTEKGKIKEKEKDDEKSKAKDKKQDWDQESSRSSQSNSRATRSSQRPATAVKNGTRISSLSELLEAAKKALEYDMYNLSIGVQYEGAVSNVPHIHIECANYRGIGPDGRALGCNARITASAVAKYSSKGSKNSEIAWTIVHVQDNHCTSCQDFNKDDKTEEIDQAEKAAFENAQEILSDGATFRKFITGNFKEEDFLKIEGASNATEGTSPNVSPGPSVQAPRKKGEQKSKSKPVNKRERASTNSDTESHAKRQRKDARGQQSESENEAVAQPAKADSIFPSNKGRLPPKVTYAKKRGTRPVPKSKAMISDSEGSSIQEIPAQSNSGFALQKAGVSLSKNQKEPERPSKVTNERRIETEVEIRVEIPAASSAADRDGSADPSSELPVPPPPAVRDNAQPSTLHTSQAPSSKSNGKLPVGRSKPRSAAIPSKDNIERKTQGVKPSSRDVNAEASSSRTIKAQAGPAAPVVPRTRPASSQAMAKRTGERVGRVEPSSDAEEESEEMRPKPAQSVPAKAVEEDDDEGSEESSQEEPPTKKVAAAEQKIKGKEVVRPAVPANAEASSSRSVQKPVAAESIAKPAAAPSVEKPAVAPIVAEAHERAPSKSIGLDTQLSTLGLPPEMLEALALSSGLLTIDDILSEVRIRATTAPVVAGEGAAPAVNIYDEIMKIVAKARASMLSNNNTYGMSDDEALAVCRRENQILGLARAAFLLRKNICTLPADVRAMGAGN